MNNSITSTEFLIKRIEDLDKEIQVRQKRIKATKVFIQKIEELDEEILWRQKRIKALKYIELYDTKSKIINN